MNHEILKEWLAHKFSEIKTRLIIVIDQMSDEQINWCPNEESNSVANLIVHISGNIKERIHKGINNLEYTRDRDQEFEKIEMTKSQIIDLTEKDFRDLIETTRLISEEKLNQTQVVRGSERTNLEILLQCSAHFSEHLGQVLYVAKLSLGDRYVTTTIPKKSSQ